MVHGKDIILAGLTGSATPNFQEIDLNPRLEDSFPSGSLSAQRYDMYEFTSLRFRYFPTSASTSTQGIVFLGWEPNANRQAPSNDATGVKVINAFEYHTQGPVWSPNVVLTVDQRHLPPPRYCRYLPTSSDLNLYDTGSLIVGTDGGPGSTIGYVEVEYSIRFYNYHLEDTLPSQSRLAVAELVVPTAVAATKEITPSFTEKFGNKLYDFVTGNEFVLPIGQYFFTSVLDAYCTGGTVNTYKLLQGAATALMSQKTTATGTMNTHSLTGMITSDGATPYKLELSTNGTDINQRAVSASSPPPTILLLPAM